MKKTILLTLALGLAGAPSLLAGNVDVYITGSTAFRANVYTACQKLFTTGSSTPVYYGDTAHGGATSGFGSSTAAWAMTGTPISGLTNLNPSGNTLTIHGLFTGSIQGMQTTEQSTKLIFPNADGTPNGNCATYSTNSPTIGFSDASGVSTPYPATGNYVEEQVCVQPFVMVKSTASSGAVTTISNVSWEQLEYGIPVGRIPLAAWTSHITDTNTFVYLMQRTKDSGTRRCETAGNYYQYGKTVGIYIYDYTNNFFYTPTVSAATTYGASPNGVVGSAGLNNANLNWGYGYVAGGDIKNSLNNNNAANQAIAYLSISDAKGVNTAGGNWANVLSYNGFWPTAAGAGIHGTTGTNDYSPITLGYYPLWGLEVLVHPTDPSKISDQDITKTQLGDQYTPGSFMGVFNYQTVNYPGSSPLTGSIENEIELSKTPSGSPAAGATAIRLSDMFNYRQSVGGTISPPFN
ncbi:MAG: hypothetical protein ABSH15_01035 [Verrucomicrobiota bacterium]|jgi:hypothetical protein